MTMRRPGFIQPVGSEPHETRDSSATLPGNHESQAGQCALLKGCPQSGIIKAPNSRASLKIARNTPAGFQPSRNKDSWEQVSPEPLSWLTRTHEIPRHSLISEASQAGG